jgi:hypothetical protein
MPARAIPAPYYHELSQDTLTDPQCCAGFDPCPAISARWTRREAAGRQLCEPAARELLLALLHHTWIRS